MESRSAGDAGARKLLITTRHDVGNAMDTHIDAPGPPGTQHLRASPVGGRVDGPGLKVSLVAPSSGPVHPVGGLNWSLSSTGPHFKGGRHFGGGKGCESTILDGRQSKWTGDGGVFPWDAAFRAPRLECPSYKKGGRQPTKRPTTILCPAPCPQGEEPSRPRYRLAEDEASLGRHGIPWADQVFRMGLVRR